MATEDATKPLVLLVSLHHMPYFDEMYGPLLSELKSKATLHRVEEATSAIRLLSEEPPPLAALVTDEALTTKQNARVWDAVLQYVRQGGTSIVMGTFSGFVKPNNIRPFFSKAGLQWEAGSYHRTTVILNEEAVGHDLAAYLPSKYSQKALFVKNVAPTDAWYRTDEDSVVESRVFVPASANVAGETPVAIARVEKGRLGYIGDVNAEQGSNAVILVLCGLLG